MRNKKVQISHENVNEQLEGPNDAEGRGGQLLGIDRVRMSNGRSKLKFLLVLLIAH